MENKIVSKLDALGYFAGPVEADESPLEPEVYLIPGGCIDMDPPSIIEPGMRYKPVDGQWVAEVIPVPQKQPDQPPPTLADVKQAAKVSIDIQAGVARSRYITVAPGQEATYLLKSAQAQQYKDAGYSGTVPVMVAAEQEAAGDASARAAADRILSEQDAWVMKAAQIEKARRSGKIAVEAAADTVGVDMALKAAEAELKAA